MKKTPEKQKITQCQKPTGWLGRLVLRNMNSRHSKVTNWGLTHVFVEKHFTILDIGCGGGRTVQDLAESASEGKVYGVDYSAESVAMSTRMNAESIEKGRVEIREGSVSQLPFATDTFDLVLAVETHFWWPDLPGDLREVRRVLKPGGKLAIVAEVYKGSSVKTARLIEEQLPKMGLKLMTPGEHRDLLIEAGFSDVYIVVDPSKGWIFAGGKKGDEPGPCCATHGNG